MLRAKAKLGSYFSLLPLAEGVYFHTVILGVRDGLKLPSWPSSTTFLIVLPQLGAVVTLLVPLGIRKVFSCMYFFGLMSGGLGNDY